MAREADKAGDRTIGVLTKCDTIERETHHTWLPVLKGASDYALRLGYYAVVNPSAVSCAAGFWEHLTDASEAGTRSA